jgi:hypothetical protein
MTDKKSCLFFMENLVKYNEVIPIKIMVSLSLFCTATAFRENKEKPQKLQV